jgi:coenzyme F420-0:L-glutamate ligase
MIRADKLQFMPVQDMPIIEQGNDLGDIICGKLDEADVRLKNHDILVVASKVVSIAEGRVVDLNTVEPSQKAFDIHAQVPRKAPEIIELMLRETAGGGYLRIEPPDFIGGVLPNGLDLTSAGVDKLGDDKAVLLPKDADASAREIGLTIQRNLDVDVGVIISDSEGRADRKGASAVAIGSYGVPPLRITPQEGEGQRDSEETIVDMVVAGAAILMGQRGTGRPVVVVSGLEYTNSPSGLSDILYKPE